MEPKLTYTKDTKADIYYGGGYKKYTNRQTHRLHYFSYFISGIKTTNLSQQELRNHHFTQVQSPIDLFKLRIAMTTDFYNDERPRAPNVWTASNIRRYGLQPNKPLTQKEIARFIMIRRSYDRLLNL